MLSGHTTQQETSFTVYCYEKTFKQVTASLNAGNAIDEPLLDVQGAVWGTSWSLRCKVHGRSSQGNAGSESTHSHLFDFRHHSLDLKNGWMVEATGDGRVLATLVHSNFAMKHRSNINAPVRTTAGEDVIVTMRQLGDGDLCLVMVMVLSRAEMAHVWGQ
jgi:hypothetical protein